jgi:Hsp20/alpha crystallin family
MPAKATVDEPRLSVAAVTRNGAWLPAVDVRELPDEYIVLADLPGLKPGDVDVTSDDNILTIAGDRRDRLHTGGVPFRLERPTGNSSARYDSPTAATPPNSRHISGTVSSRSASPKRRTPSATQSPTSGGRWHARVAESSRPRRPAYGGTDTLARRVPTMTSTP